MTEIEPKYCILISISCNKPILGFYNDFISRPSLLSVVFQIVRWLWISYDMNCSFTSRESACRFIGSNTTILPLDSCKLSY